MAETVELKSTRDPKSVNEALEILEGLGFSPLEQAWTLGYAPLDENLEDADAESVRHFVVMLDRIGIDTRARVAMVIAIKAKLEIYFPGNIDAQRDWLDAPHHRMHNLSPKTMMITGYSELKAVKDGGI